MASNERSSDITLEETTKDNSSTNSSSQTTALPEIDYNIVDALPPQKNTEKNDIEIEEQDDIKKEKKKPTPDQKITLSQLFRFATFTDKLLMIFGSVGAMGNGASVPLMTIVFSSIIQAFLNFTIAIIKDPASASEARDTLNHDLRKNLIYFVALAVGVFILAYAQLACWMLAGERQAKRIRQLYFAAVLRQDIAWFDSVATGDVISRISSDVEVVQDGISEKLAGIIQYLTTFFSAFIIAFFKGWRLALVLCCILPLLTASGIFMAKSLSNFATRGQDAYAEAGAVAEQVLSSIKTIAAFGGQEREAARYKKKLDAGYELGKKQSIVQGIGIGSIMLIVFSTYGLAFYYGAKLVVEHKMDSGQVVNVFFAVLIGAFALGNAGPNFGNLGTALGAAAKLYAVIDRVPVIDVTSDNGKKLDKSSVKGRIEFKNVNFHYPSRPDVPVLKNFSLTIKPGQTVALVGSSGSGKSTIVNLLERFYDPISGQVIIDGEKIQDINIKSLRKHVGLVGQEPVLFPASVRENVEWGSAVDGKKPTLEEIIAACKKSNVHEFIDQLPDKYETLVGEKGALMSGGQKQRIAIARALIKDPAILLLDEATSALDTESEALVQEALDAASENRTTVVIAHRLSTIKNADMIVVMSKGEIVEVGTHNELIARQDVYYGLVKAQDESIIKIDEEGDDEKREKLVKRITTKASSNHSVHEKEAEEEDYSKLSAPWLRVAKMSRPDILYVLVGSFGAAVMGCVMPLFSLIYSTILNIFSKTDPNQLRHDANFWAGMFVVLAGAAFIAITGYRITTKIRDMTFRALLRQEMAFFDDERNSTGALTSKLSTEATQIQGLVTICGTVVQTISSLVAGLLIAFINGWKLTLVVFSVSPLLVLAAYLEMKAHAGFGAKTAKAYGDSGKIVQQGVSNMRTIASLNREDTFKALYKDAIAEPHKIAVHGALVASIGFGASHALQFGVWALAFWYGGKLLGDQEYNLKQMLSVLFAIVFTAQNLGQMSMFAPNTAKAKVAAISIFKLLDRNSSIDPDDVEGKIRPAPVTGECNLSNVRFRYPARRNVKILKGLDAGIPAGKSVAFVGPSGCGKSTIISLLLRYYDADSGAVNIERTNVKDWNLEYMRANMALVGQEPVLFDLTIGENIAYGKEGCSQEEIIEAAKRANIHNFVTSLPLGYDTPVGEKGTQLSGGQKQRVAIARALIRNPKILLLDEATSALDSESEKVVQNALDRASTGRTTITIAHRLSTIQNCDLILVIKKGKVEEAGKHLDLIAQRGLYFELVTRQTLTKGHADL
ncbi:2904_t:CDS:10 [Ambispora leptoticha]|uniref:2904_t:CDS:1 n=1 Tax=Ambispora leptoticha TaxID=144679 RepID=A0A9N8YQ19_9GLOM|nr:2904_t:CDS:10 [Ambispora leptoticha]